MNAMIFLIVVSTLATFGVLMAGGISMFRGARYDMTHEFPLMEARVIVQGITLVLVLVTALFWV